jgi:hypothetical protein
MDSKSYIEIAKERVEKDHFYLSHHSQIERGKEQIKVDDIVSAIINGRELEPYPDDPRGESCLIVGQGLDSRWLHVLCGNFHEEDLLIITVYIPRLPKWVDPFTRRE